MKIYFPDYSSARLISGGTTSPLFTACYSEKYVYQIAASMKEANCATSQLQLIHFMRGRMGDLHELAALCKINGRRLFIWHDGDLNPPLIDNITYLQAAVDRTPRTRSRVCVPYFITDPLEKFYDGQLTLIEKIEKPQVAFCGYASISAPKLLYGAFTNLKMNAAARFRKDSYLPGIIIPATRLRNRVLSILAKDNRIVADFIIRDKYMAGAENFREKYGGTNQTASEFYQNIISNLYVVCVRGFGNFSIRFYETLACGRIPIFIDTNSGLPFDDEVDYKNHCVYVPEKEIANAADILLDFHARHSGEEIKAVQRNNRNLWEERLSFNGFFARGQVLENSILNL